MTETALAALGWSEWLAIAAITVSGVSAIFAFRADQRAGRVERREEERHVRERDQAQAFAPCRARRLSSRIRKRR